VKLLLAKKPHRSPCYLNRIHPHANGLRAAYLFNDNGSKVWDFTRNGNVLDVVNASWVAEGMQFDANGEYAELDNTGQIVNSEAGTIILYFKSLSAFNDNAIRSLFGYYVWEGSLCLQKYSNNLLYVLLVDGGGASHYVYFDSTKVPNWTTGTCIAVQWDRQNVIYDSKNIAMAVNGEYKTPTNSAGATSWPTYTINSNWYVGNNAGGTTQHCNGIISYCDIYNRVLNETELKNIYKKPYKMFQAPSSQMYLNLLGSYKSGLQIKQNYYGANAFPIGRGL
jgi:hypothetical protein